MDEVGFSLEARNIGRTKQTRYTVFICFGYCLLCCHPKIKSWKQKLPLHTVLRLLQVLVPQVERLCLEK